ncbi:VOC family protein [Corynebacterium sp. AOP40-9SA-29]|uniref:VOC family protein n=1 Tax=Corynebacterium sp. AOP40-9SA-29 TaxID=3457677 RepID=UPI004033CC8D
MTHHTTSNDQRIVPRLRLQVGDHGVVGAARFYTDAFRPFEEAGLELGATGGTATDEGIDLLVAGMRLHLTDAADNPDAEGISPATNMMVNIDPVFFGWTPDGTQDARRAAQARARAVLDTVWEGLAEDARAVLMPLDEYPFSARYGWVLDRYGMSWQVMLTDPTGQPRPALIPSFLFGGEAQNRAGEALEAWTEVFMDVFGRDGGGGTGTGTMVTYPQETGPAVAGSVMFADVRLLGTWFSMMDSATEQPFTFTDAVSFRVYCDTPVQAEVLSRELGLDGHTRCGVDRFGVSWEILLQP